MNLKEKEYPDVDLYPHTGTKTQVLEAIELMPAINGTNFANEIFLINGWHKSETCNSTLKPKRCPRYSTQAHPGP